MKFYRSVSLEVIVKMIEDNNFVIAPSKLTKMESFAGCDTSANDGDVLSFWFDERLLQLDKTILISCNIPDNEIKKGVMHFGVQDDYDDDWTSYTKPEFYIYKTVDVEIIGIYGSVYDRLIEDPEETYYDLDEEEYEDWESGKTKPLIEKLMAILADKEKFLYNHLRYDQATQEKEV